MDLQAEGVSEGEIEMGSTFKTYDGKRCGQCKIRLSTSGFCVHELERVEKTTPACKHFKEN